MFRLEKNRNKTPRLLLAIQTFDERNEYVFFQSYPLQSLLIITRAIQGYYAKVFLFTLRYD